MSTVIRVEKNREYVVMNNKFLRNKNMSLKAKGLLALCLSLPDDWDYSMNGLASICKESLTSIRSSLKELEDHGHLIRTKKNAANGRFFYEYVLYEVPHTEPHNDSPHIQNVHAVNIDVQNVHVQNDIQQSIEEKSIKEQSIKELNLYIQEHAYAATWSLFNDYLEMRKEIGAPLTMRGLKMLLTRVEKLSDNNINIQRLMLENAIQNQWKNVYRPKDQEIKATLDAQTNELKSFYGI